MSELKFAHHRADDIWRRDFHDLLAHFELDGECKKSRDFEFHYKRAQALSQAFDGAAVTFSLKTISACKELYGDRANLVYPKGGAWPFFHMSRHAARLTGDLPESRFHEVWATLKFADAIQLAEHRDQKPLFVRHLAGRRIVSNQTPNIMVCDTDVLESGRGSAMAFTTTLCSDEVMAEAEKHVGG